MKVTGARPERKRRHEEINDGEDAEAAKKTAKKARKDKKTKKEQGLLPGVELRERKVKRGWTEPETDPKAKKSGKKDKEGKKTKSKVSSYTTKPELLFKTNVPPNATPLEDRSDTKASKNKKKKKKGKADGEVVVHEFEHTTKTPSFLRDSEPTNGTNGTAAYEDGKGWLDAQGAVVEAEHESKKTKKQKAQKSVAVIPKESTPVPAIELSHPSADKSNFDDDQTSSSGSSQAENEESASASPTPLITTTSPPLPTSSPQPNAPHPLETLFKRPAAPTSTPTSHAKGKPNLEVSTSFSFFDPDDDDPGATTAHLAPQTPYTQMDIRQRRQRSAAPTPDTAMPGKSFFTEGRGRRSDSLDEGSLAGKGEDGARGQNGKRRSRSSQKSSGRRGASAIGLRSGA